MKEKRLAGAALYHIIIFAIGIIMVYPLIWMVMSSFKETNTIFTTASSLIPEHFVTDNYANGWKGFAKISFSTFFKNSIFISVIATIGTIASSAVVAYGFARFKFPWKRKFYFPSMTVIHDASCTGSYDPAVSVVPEIRLGRFFSFP